MGEEAIFKYGEVSSFAQIMRRMPNFVAIGPHAIENDFIQKSVVTFIFF